MAAARVVAERHAGAADAGHLAGVAAQRGMAGRFERGAEAQVG